MAIPDFQSVMRPVLATVQDGLGVSVKQVYEVKQLDSDYFVED